MTEFEFLGRNIFFTTRSFALFLDKELASASRKLKTLAERKDVTQVTRGLWANQHHPEYTPYGAIPYLLDREQGYLSFLSALHRHDMISQIPSSIQIATTGRGRVLKSSIGEFHFFQIKPELMQVGVEVFEETVVYNMASKEKALLDTFYVATKKGHRFKKLPEIDFDTFNQKQFFKWLKLYPVAAQKQISDRYLGLIK